MKESICFLLVLIMVIGCSSFVFADQKENKGEEYTIGEAYVYPIVPGTNEWNNFDTVFEMIDACQIPEDVLKSMTTEALAKTVLNYPLLMDLIAGSTAREGFESMLSNFNGFQELSKRPEASSYLGNEYLELSNNNSQTKSYDAEQQLKENLTGILLQQPEFGGELVLSQISPKATPPQYEYVTLVTAKGNSIQIKNCTLDYDKEQLNYMNSEYDKMYPKATRLSSATAKQNCHAYAFLGKGGNALD